jgi:hypothetical protein
VRESALDAGQLKYGLQGRLEVTNAGFRFCGARPKVIDGIFSRGNFLKGCQAIRREWQSDRHIRFGGIEDHIKAYPRNLPFAAPK